MITVKINVNKIDKSALFKGAKGTYLDVILFETPDDQYGNDYRVVQSLSKERRAAGDKGAILGNGKVYGQSQASAGEENQAPPDDTYDYLPF